MLFLLPIGGPPGLEQRDASEKTSLPALLEGTARGDRQAFRTLYEAAAPKLFGVILRILTDRAAAEDVLQETFVRIWQKAERYQPDAGPPMPWLTAIARNRAIDRIRAGRMERSRTADDDDVLNRIAAPSAGDPVMREALRRCLGGLDEESRKTVLLAYCSGYSREELAERFGRPVGTVKTILHRSLKLLKACLERG
jgi:RNA polymerase sigma-70 factor (ECF subfamily)